MPLTILRNPLLLQSDAIFRALGDRQAELSRDSLLMAASILLIAMSLIVALLNAQLETKVLLHLQ
jgi:hypothetical protein